MSRRKKFNEQYVPSTIGSGISTGTVSGDVSSFLIVPADAYIGRSLVRGSANGTGTGTFTMTWRDAGGGAGNAISSNHLDPAGAEFDQDANASVSYRADGNGTVATEDKFLVLRLTANGSITGAATFGLGIFLVL